MSRTVLSGSFSRTGSMRQILCLGLIAGMTASAVNAGPFGVFGRRSGSGGVTAGGPPVASAFNSSAQGVANHMARILRIGHFGGYNGYEGVGMGSTPYQAEMSCCFRHRMQPREVGIAQGSNGMYYACCRY